MQSQKLSRSTSTPFISSHYDCDTEDVDSGFHSFCSGQYSSANYSIRTPVESTKFFVERKHIDFLHYLGEKNDYTVIVEKILKYLSDEDLYNAAAVSKTWKRIIISIPAHRKTLNLYSKKVESTKENRMVPNDKNTRGTNVVHRSMLREIQNKRSLNTNSPRSPASSSPRNRIEAFQIEAQRMKMGKRLYSCPKCNLPSQVDEKEVQTAVCTNSFCRYRFCILCQCVVHPSRVCDFISTPVMRKQRVLVGSRNSKKNLRRLLLN